jgi:transcription factor TFIIIB component B''
MPAAAVHSESEISVLTGSMPPPLVIPTRMEPSHEEPPSSSSSIANHYNFSLHSTTSVTSVVPQPAARKPRTPSVKPFDASAGPGEEIDPTVITMAALCDDTGQGRVSSKAAEIQTNHVAWRTSNRDKRAHMKSVMEEKKFRKRADGEGDPKAPAASTSSNQNATPGPSSIAIGSTSASLNPTQAGDISAEGNHGFDYSQDLATSKFNVQVRIGPNGETVIDEESLFVDRTDEEETENYTHVEESDNTKFVNSGTYGRKFRGSRWSAEETELFYHVSLAYFLVSFILLDIFQRLCRSLARTMS